MRKTFWAMMEFAENGGFYVSLIDEPEEKPPLVVTGLEDLATLHVIPSMGILLAVPAHTILAAGWVVVIEYLGQKN